jgi:hypothetical protein
MSSDFEFQRNMRNAAEQVMKHIYDTDYFQKWKQDQNKRGRPKKIRYPSVAEIKDLIIEDIIQVYGLDQGFYLKDINRTLCERCASNLSCMMPGKNMISYCSTYKREHKVKA